MKEALLYKKSAKKNKVECFLCAHRCKIKEGDFGVCTLRKNVGGKLFTTSYGTANSYAIDPIEKKPFFHFKPGTKALSFGTPGCNFTCENCQNWRLSQSAREILEYSPKLSPESIVRAAADYKVDGIAYTYSEPTIFFEYALDVIKLCKNDDKLKDLYHVFVSNGYLSKELIDKIIDEKILDAINIDLKFIRREPYERICGAKLEPVKYSIKRFAESDIFLEIINLIIPGENDKRDDFRKTAEFVAAQSPDIPIHFNRFTPTFKMSDKYLTPIETLIEAREIAREVGLNYVYIGNADVPKGGDTNCPNCDRLLLSRTGGRIMKANLKPSGASVFCPECEEKINIRL